ncbi:FtsQ-type POTRA domain-containing protein [Alphaproteobacteria bacterium]|nr:FtsQ-type POTRA domain-containing protein [Alphaproteobacteria bacterium]
MLNSIINQNITTKHNIDRVTTKKDPLYYNKLILITLIIPFFFTISLSHIDYNKQIKTFNQFLINNGFAITNIQILGIKNISKETVIQIVNAENKSNIFNVNLSKIYNNLSDNDWVKDLNVERILPNTIKIKILEKKPIGIWQNEMSNKLITENGEIISTANVNKFKNNLPIIHGDNANKNANSILNILRKNQLFAKNIWSLTYINNRRWNLYFKQGIIVLLPSKGVLKSWNKIIKLQEQYDVLNLGLTELDLRNPGKVLGRINFDKNLIKRRKNL